jgi:hypothetical protein
MGSLLTAGVLGVGAEAGAASLSQPLLKAGESARSGAIEIKYRGRRSRPFPIAPSYLYYDYPYYYSRGFYPTHIRPGFIYFGRPYFYEVRGYYPRYGGRRSKVRKNSWR